MIAEQTVYDPTLHFWFPLRELDRGSRATVISRDAIGHVGTATGALWDGEGYSFDGSDDKIVIPHHASLNNLTQITVACWVRPMANQRMALVGKGTTVPTRVWLLEDYISGTDHYFYFGVRTAGGWVEKEWLAGAALGHWYHIVGVYDGANILVYGNGFFRNSQAQTGAITVQTSSMYIGIDTNGTSNPFKGTLDDVRVLTRALTPQEVQRMYLDSKGYH